MLFSVTLTNTDSLYLFVFDTLLIRQFQGSVLNVFVSSNVISRQKYGTSCNVNCILLFEPGFVLNLNAFVTVKCQVRYVILSEQIVVDGRKERAETKVFDFDQVVIWVVSSQHIRVSAALYCKLLSL